MKNSVVTYVLMVYMDGAKDYTLKNEFPANAYGGESQAYKLAKAVGEEYNKQGHDFVIMQEVITPVHYIISEKNKERLL
jgi:hypothetical protein